MQTNRQTNNNNKNKQITKRIEIIQTNKKTRSSMSKVSFLPRYLGHLSHKKMCVSK